MCPSFPVDKCLALHQSGSLEVEIQACTYIFSHQYDNEIQNLRIVDYFHMIALLKAHVPTLSTEVRVEADHNLSFDTAPPRAL